MARIRTIKPIHWNDKELPKISLQAHLLWIASWNFSDDDGVFESDPLLIKSQIFPRRTDIRVEQVSQWLDQLVKARYIIPFQYKGEGYYISRTFKTHQRIDKPQPGIVNAEELDNILTGNEEIQEHSQNIPRTFPPVEEGIVKEGKGGESRALPDLSNSNIYRQPKIPQWEEVHRVFLLQGGNEEMAKKFFETNEATGWFYKSSPITNFVTQVPGYIKSWKENDLKKINQNANSKSRANQQLDQREWLAAEKRKAIEKLGYDGESSFVR